jgi:hypothetical protein
MRKELVELHREMWRLDDRRNYPRLRRVSKRLFLLEGFKGKADAASRAVTRAYYWYKLAKENRGRRELRERYLSKTRDFLISASRALGEPEESGALHMLWWRFFFWKNYAPIPFVLFLQHLAKGLWPIASLKCALYLALAGFRGHDTRSRQITDYYLAKYWRVVERTGKRVAMF